jgi:5-methylcytosine-specific restriction protein A
VNGKDSSNKETKVNNLLIKLKENNLSNSETESLLDEDDLVIVISTNDIVELDIDEAEFIPAIKPEKVIGSRTSYKRNVDKAKKCILLANYKCEIDNNHKSFVSKNGNPYMEAHHLIPLSTQEYFEYSLDVDANIICLCPNCHKKLHHGGNIETDLRRIYDDRINNLKKSGIDIDFKVLLELYR